MFLASLDIFQAVSSLRWIVHTKLVYRNKLAKYSQKIPPKAGNIRSGLFVHWS